MEVLSLEADHITS